MVGRVPQRQLVAVDSGGTVHTVQTATKAVYYQILLEER